MARRPSAESNDDRRARGFTLIEMLLALSIGAALLVIMFGGLRVGLAAWSRGEARAMALEHDRSLAQCARDAAVAGTYPYRGAPARAAGRCVSSSKASRTGSPSSPLSPSIPAPVPIAFTAVSLSRDEQGLAVRQLTLPNLEPLDRVAPVLVDRDASIAVRFRYLGEEPEPGRTGGT